MKSNPDHPAFQEGTRVMLEHDEHPQHQKTATVMVVLPNPSGLGIHQWYDIHFDDGKWGRFLERHLQGIAPDEMAPPRLEDQGQSPSPA